MKSSVVYKESSGQQGKLRSALMDHVYTWLVYSDHGNREQGSDTVPRLRTHLCLTTQKEAPE